MRRKISSKAETVRPVPSICRQILRSIGSAYIIGKIRDIDNKRGPDSLFFGMDTYYAVRVQDLTKYYGDVHAVDGARARLLRSRKRTREHQSRHSNNKVAQTNKIGKLYKI